MSHSHTCLLHHFICGVKRRQRLILPTVRPRLDEYIGGILRAESCALLAAGGMPDHSHWFVRLHPSKAPADLMRIVKSNSTGWLKETFPETAVFAWQTGYGGFSVSRSGADAVMAYIASQEEHHRTMTFEEEYIAFLDRHGVEYDPRDLFD